MYRRIATTISTLAAVVVAVTFAISLRAQTPPTDLASPDGDHLIGVGHGSTLAASETVELEIAPGRQLRTQARVTLGRDSPDSPWPITVELHVASRTGVPPRALRALVELARVTRDGVSYRPVPGTAERSAGPLRRVARVLLYFELPPGAAPTWFRTAVSPDTRAAIGRWRIEPAPSTDGG